MYSRSSSRIGWYLWLAFAVSCSLWSAARAVDPPPPERLVIHEQYWQVLPELSWVYVDHDGNPWYCLPQGDVAKSYESDLHALPANTKMLLGDRAGRIWIKDRYQSGPVRYYDGSAWHETHINARLVAEDDSGRVFLLDATSIHVLEGSDWSEQRVFTEDAYPDGHFAKDAQGRIWFWAQNTPRGSGTPGKYAGTSGVWAYDDGTWANHSLETGFPFKDVETLLPLGNSRFLVINADREKSPNFSVWSSERKLTKAESSHFPPDATPARLRYAATDPEGNHFLSALGGKSELLTIGVDEKVTWLSLEQIESMRRMLKGIYENREKLHSTLEETPPPTPVDPGEVICQDRHGRIYFRHDPGVGVLWPKYEKPGDTLRLTHSPLMRQIFQDTGGTIWGQPFGGPTALAKWDGNGWRDTPVKLLPHPPWRNRRGPPWYAWHVQSPVFLPGENDTFLVVAVRDVYQDVADEWMEPEPIDANQLLELAKERIAERGQAYWFAGWLWEDGEWTGPLPVEKLLTRHCASLIENFTRNSKQTAPFNLQSDGKYLWVAYDGKVFVYADHPRGDLTDRFPVEWRLPNQPKTGLSQACLCRLPDGRMLCSLPTNEYEKFQLHALSLQDDHIVAERFPLPEQASYVSRNPRWNDWYPYVTSQGDLWLWLGYRVYQFQQGKWIVREDLDHPLFEEADGSLWFLPGQGHDGRDENRGYRIVNGEKSSTFPWPGEYPFGWLTPAPSGEVHAACGYWQITLSAADDPLNRKITKARINSRYVAGPVFEVEKGTYLFGAGVMGTTEQ